MTVRLIAAADHVDEILRALRTVMHPARRDRGCAFAHVWRSADDQGCISYVEEWDDPAALHRQFGAERFVRLLELIEAAAEPPTIEFRIFTERHGLEYITAPPESGGLALPPTGESAPSHTKAEGHR